MKCQPSPAEIMHLNQWFPKSYIVSFCEGQGCNAVVTITLLPGRGDAFLLIWLLLWLSRESGSLRHPLQSLQAASNCCFKKQTLSIFCHKTGSGFPPFQGSLKLLEGLQRGLQAFQILQKDR